MKAWKINMLNFSSKVAEIFRTVLTLYLEFLVKMLWKLSTFKPKIVLFCEVFFSSLWYMLWYSHSACHISRTFLCVNCEYQIILLSNHFSTSLPMGVKFGRWHCGWKEVEGVWEHGVEENIGPRRDEVTGEWRRLHNEEINVLYTSPNIVRVIKSRRMRWAGHVTRMTEEKGCIGSWWGNRRERDHWGDLSVDG